MLRITELAGKQVSGVLQKGDVAVDATAGKGRDTLFLARLVSPGGKVYAFDIQQAALRRTAALLEKNDLMAGVTLIHDGHESMASHVSVPVAAVMFNLGYLPGGDHSIVTRPETTRQGLAAALRLLKPAGLVTIVLYPGHAWGAKEKTALLEYCRRLDRAYFRVIYTQLLNCSASPPELLVIKSLTCPGRSEQL